LTKSKGSIVIARSTFANKAVRVDEAGIEGMDASRNYTISKTDGLEGKKKKLVIVGSGTLRLD
jgi:hypothetical protein